ncbi:MAG: RICIN domain-containing protein [Acidimicrobiales bacterium]
MTLSPFRTVRLLATRLLPVTVVASLFTTGVVTANQTTAAKATVSDKVQILVEGVASPGFSRATETGQPTQLVGFEWQGRHQGAVEVRARQESGAWSAWHRVEGDPNEGPDANSPEHHDQTTAGPIWVGKDVRHLETRVVEGSLSGVKVHALRSEAPTAAPGTKPAGATPAQPGIVSRAAWGADESYRSLNTGYGCASAAYAPDVKMAIVHHTASPDDYTPADSAPYMRGIYYFHTHTNQWCDIGYNFVVDRFGTVFEGRFGGVTQPVIGAHALGFNTETTGVALLGTFADTAVPSAMYSGLRALLAWKLSIHGVNPTAIISFNGLTLSTVSGHRDVNATSCPGDLPYGLLPQLRTDLAGLVDTPATGPTPAPTPVPTAAPPPTPTATMYAVQSASSGLFIDVNDASRSAGAGVIQWPNNGALNQRWVFVDLGNGVFGIASANSGMVLDVAGGSTLAGAPVVQWPWSGALSQLWRVIFLGDPSANPRLAVVQLMKTGMVLDLAGASTAPGGWLTQWPWAGYVNQFWWGYRG